LLVEAVVDTGFSAFLTLPRVTIEQLSLQSQGALQVILADGNSIETETFSARVELNGELHAVYVVHTETQPLIGMSFLQGHQLTIEVRDGGAVSIQTL
jgi:clan AA aspartic protease